MTKTILYVLAFLLTCLGVEWFRRWSLRRKLLDMPNERSSHTVPTPRGGGLIVVLVCLSIFFGYGFFFQANVFWSYLAGASIVAFISWLDDLKTVSSLWRFLCHSLAAAGVVWHLGFFESVYVPFYGILSLGEAGPLITFFWIVWLINAYNFMDGIDGIAGAQAFTAGIGWLLLGSVLGAGQTAFYGGAIAFASLGFLWHNWPPAKIFMGDVGSAFLGYTFAVMPLLAAREASGQGDRWPLIATLLVGLFVFDSILTLMRRLWRREKIWQAHREHIYQRLVLSGLSHKFVTVLYALFSISILVFLLFWIENRTFSADIIFIIIVFMLICLLIYSYRRKTLT